MVEERVTIPEEIMMEEGTKEMDQRGQEMGELRGGGKVRDGGKAVMDGGDLGKAVTDRNGVGERDGVKERMTWRNTKRDHFSKSPMPRGAEKANDRHFIFSG